MKENYYKILGLSQDATDDEINYKYQSLRQKYQEERFMEGEKGNEAAKKLTELDLAYNEIMSSRREQGTNQSGDTAFEGIEKAIKSGDLYTAQQLLDNFDERTAEWHYLQSVVFYKKNWTNESKKQLEIALDMDKNNEKYKKSYERLKEQIDFNDKSSKDNSAFKSGNQSGTYESPQMGGNGCIDYCCEMIACNMLLNCCCNSCR